MDDENPLIELDQYFQQQSTINVSWSNVISMTQSLIKHLTDDLVLSSSIPEIIQNIQSDMSTTINQLANNNHHDDNILAGRLLTTINQRSSMSDILSEYGKYSFSDSTSLLNSTTIKYLSEQDWWNSKLIHYLNINQVQHIYPYLWRSIGATYPLETIESLHLRMTAVLTSKLPDISPSIYHYLQNGILQLPPSLLVSLGTTLGPIVDDINLQVKHDILQLFVQHVGYFRRPTNIYIKHDYNNLLNNVLLVNQFNNLLPSTSNICCTLCHKSINMISLTDVIWLDNNYTIQGDIAYNISLLAESSAVIDRRPFIINEVTHNIILDVGQLHLIKIDNMYNIIRHISQVLSFVDHSSVARNIRLINYSLSDLPMIVFNLWLGNIEIAASNGSNAQFTNYGVQWPTLTEYDEPGSWGQFKIVHHLTGEQIFSWSDLYKLKLVYGLSYPMTISIDYLLDEVDQISSESSSSTSIRQFGKYVNIDLSVVKSNAVLSSLSSIWKDEYLSSIRFLN